MLLGLAGGWFCSCGCRDRQISLASKAIAALRTFETGQFFSSIAGHLSKRSFVHAGHFGTQGQVRPADAEPLALRLKRDRRLGFKLRGRVSGALQQERQAPW